MRPELHSQITLAARYSVGLTLPSHQPDLRCCAQQHIDIQRTGGVPDGSVQAGECRSAAARPRVVLPFESLFQLGIGAPTTANSEVLPNPHSRLSSSVLFSRPVISEGHSWK